MATIDPRLLPLIETLVDSGADWLAFEILDGIRAGRHTEDSEEEIREARRAVHSFRRNKKTSPPEIQIKETSMEPIVGDDQIDFSINYVIDRISQVIEMTGSTLVQLSQIASQSNAHSELLVPGDGDRATSIHIRLEGSEVVSNTILAEEALNRLPELRTSLLEWSKSVRQGKQEA
jgi:hypothetical protein